MNPMMNQNGMNPMMNQAGMNQVNPNPTGDSFIQI